MPSQSRTATLGALAVCALALCLLVVPGWAQGGSAEAEVDWRFIDKLLGDGMEEVAARQLQVFAMTYGEDARAPEALLRAGQLWEGMDRGAAAIVAYDQLLKTYPSNPVASQALLRKGNLLAGQESFQEAANVFRGLLSSYPASDEVDRARLGLGEALLSLDQTPEASRLFRFLLAGQVEPAVASRALFDLGVLHEKAGADSLAIISFEAVSQRFPSEVLGAFGLLRAADIYVTREAPEAARGRYRRVLEDYDEVFLRARARLGLADLAEAEEDFKGAAKQYREVAEEGGTEAQLETALLGLARCEFLDEDTKSAREAATAYLERFPEGKRSDRARLIQYQADLQDGTDEAPAALRDLASSAGAEVAYEALETLARHAEENDDAAGAAAGWRDAARVAPDAAGRFAALMAQSNLLGESQRHHLAAEFALEAHGHAPVADDAALALEAAMEETSRAEDASRALELAERIVSEHPLSASAARARVLTRRLQREVAFDATAAAERLATIAVRDDVTPLQRHLAVGVTLRDVLGDEQAALKSFDAALALAELPVERARLRVEAGKAHEAAALRWGVEAEGSRAKSALERARSHYADAAAEGGQSPAGREGLLGLIRLEMGLAVLPDSPWDFAADTSPLLGGIGPLETLDLTSRSLVSLRPRMETALEYVTEDDDRAWLRWRLAELHGEAELAQRIAWIQKGLEAGPRKNLELCLRYGMGQLHLLADDSREAASQLRRVIDVAPTSELAMAARYGLAETHRGARRFDQAGTLYTEFAGAYPLTQKGQRALLLAGDCALFAGDAETAQTRYRELLDRFDTSVYRDDATYRLGTAQQRLGRLEAARESFRRLAGWQGTTDYRGRGLLKLAQLEQSAQRDSAAVDVWTELLRVDVELARQNAAELELAEIELNRDRPQPALSWLDRSTEEEPSARALALRTGALSSLGRFDAALAALERLSRGYPDQGAVVTAARLDLAEALAGEGRTEQALEEFRAAAADAPDAGLRGRAKYGAGLALARAGRFDEALPLFDETTRVAPGTEWEAEAQFKIGGVAAQAGDDARARDAFTAVYQGFPEHRLAPEALRGAAMAWRRQGRFDKALESYHSLLEQYPDVPDGEQILSQIAYCHHELGQHEVAIRAYQKVMPLLDEEEQAYAHFWIADSLEQLERFEDAAAAFLRIPYLYPGEGQLSVTAQLKAAGVYELMGDAEAAVRLYEKVVASHGPNSQWGGEAAKRLDRIQQGNRGDS